MAPVYRTRFIRHPTYPQTHIATLVECLVSKSRGSTVTYFTREPDENDVRSTHRTGRTGQRLSWLARWPRRSPRGPRTIHASPAPSAPPSCPPLLESTLTDRNTVFALLVASSASTLRLCAAHGPSALAGPSSSSR